MLDRDDPRFGGVGRTVKSYSSWINCTDQMACTSDPFSCSNCACSNDLSPLCRLTQTAAANSQPDQRQRDLCGSEGGLGVPG